MTLSQVEADRVLVGLVDESLSAKDVEHLTFADFGSYIDGFLFSILAALAELGYERNRWFVRRLALLWEHEGILVCDGRDERGEAIGRAEGDELMAAWWRIHDLARCA